MLLYHNNIRSVKRFKVRCYITVEKVSVSGDTVTKVLKEGTLINTFRDIHCLALMKTSRPPECVHTKQQTLRAHPNHRVTCIAVSSPNASFNYYLFALLLFVV